MSLKTVNSSVLVGPWPSRNNEHDTNVVSWEDSHPFKEMKSESNVSSINVGFYYHSIPFLNVTSSQMIHRKVGIRCIYCGILIERGKFIGCE